MVYSCKDVRLEMVGGLPFCGWLNFKATLVLANGLLSGARAPALLQFSSFFLNEPRQASSESVDNPR